MGFNKYTEDLARKFLENYELAGANATKAAKATNIDRSTYVRWRKKHNWFDEECEQIEEGLIDEAQDCLMKSIRKGNPLAQIFFLKTKAKHRGYSEQDLNKHRIEGGELITRIQLVLPGEKPEEVEVKRLDQPEESTPVQFDVVENEDEETKSQ